MKKTNLLLIAVLVMAMVVPSAVFAASTSLTLTVSATIRGGTSLDSTTVYSCDGRTYVAGTHPAASAACHVGSMGSLDFNDPQESALLMMYTGKDGKEHKAAGFYSPIFYAVYFYPSCWGGKTYELSQGAPVGMDPAFNDAFRRAIVFTTDDLWDSADPTSHQAAIDTTSNPPESLADSSSGDTGYAKDPVTFLTGNQDHIISLWYGIPLNPDVSQPGVTAVGKYGVPFKTAAKTYTMQIPITFTEK